MRLHVWVAAGGALLIPSVLALEYGNLSLLYTDAPFHPAEAAGISVLTELKAVEGYPDGSFHPERTLNRAEFLKIVLLSSPGLRVASADAESCFPDVSAGDWFSRYVCLAKKRGIVSGYPDGYFRPANSVNYAEALKMLAGLYEYDISPTSEDSWFSPYARAAMERRTALPMDLSYAQPLTRGQMARLAAAFRAEHEGSLAQYRTAELGEYVRSSSSSSAASQESAGSSAAGIVSSATSSHAPLPAVASHALMVGSSGTLVAEGVFTPWADDAIIRIAIVKLDREVKSLGSLHLLTSDGVEIGTLNLDIYDTANKTWKGYYESAGAYRLPKSTQTRLLIAADLKNEELGGRSGEWVDIKEISLVTQNIGDGLSTTLIAQNYTRIPHITAVAKLSEIRNVPPESDWLATGSNRRIASFAFSGSTAGSAELHLEQLVFDLERSFGVELSDWKIRKVGTAGGHQCYQEGAQRVSCSGIDDSIGLLEDGAATIELFADVALAEPSDDRTLQVFLIDPGTITEGGAVWWSDGVTRFTWVEQEQPIAAGQLWRVRENS